MLTMRVHVRLCVCVLAHPCPWLGLQTEEQVMYGAPLGHWMPSQKYTWILTKFFTTSCAEW